MATNKSSEFRRPEALFNKYLEDFSSLGIYCYEKGGNPQSDKEWTNRNLGYFQMIGEGEGFDCWHMQHEGEYHVDLCWYHGYPDNYARSTHDWAKNEHYMELALEHELAGSPERIYYAFSKLVDVKAYIKVFVAFVGKSIRNNLPSMLSRVASTSPFRLEGENYLLIVSWDRKESEALQIDGYAMDNRGALTALGSKTFPGTAPK